MTVDVDALVRGRGALQVYPFPGLTSVTVGFRPLPAARIDELRQDVRSALRARTGREPDGSDLEAALERRVLAEAAVDGDRPQRAFFDPPERVDELDEGTTRALVALFTATQERCSPALSEDAAHDVLEAMKARATSLEAARARHAVGLCAYYGLAAATDATEWQVVWYLELTRGADDGTGVLVDAIARLFGGGRRRR